MTWQERWHHGIHGGQLPRLACSMRIPAAKRVHSLTDPTCAVCYSNVCRLRLVKLSCSSSETRHRAVTDSRRGPRHRARSSYAAMAVGMVTECARL